jgi:ADP-heptose:LPS heptosyltransferase
MNLNTIRKIDAYFGPALGVVLLLMNMIRRTWSSDQKLNSQTEIKRIMVVKFFGLGSILLSIPALKAAKQKFPQATISIFTLSENLEICTMIPFFDQYYTIDLNRPGMLIWDYARTLMKIRKQHYDVIVDLEFVTNFSAITSLLVILITPRITSVGFSSPLSWRNSVYSFTVPLVHRHISETFVKVFSTFCGKINDIGFGKQNEFLLNTDDKEFLVETLLGVESLKGAIKKDIVCVNINAGELSLLRRWPKEHFSVLINELVETHDVYVVLLGSKKEVAYVDSLVEILHNNENIINVCGQISLGQLRSLLAASKLLITNDSGPLHIASVIGTPTISFFGPETPALYGPLGKNHYVFYDNLYCSPCLNVYNSKSSKCKNNLCLKNINPDSVLKLIEEENLISSAGYHRI